MKLEGKQIAEYAGILAVVVSLLFVAFELRLSNTIAVRESSADILDRWFEISRIAYENPTVASLLTKLQDPSPTLTAEEEVRATNLANTYSTVIGLLNASYTAGTLPEYALDVHLSIFENVFRTYPGIVPYFSSSRNNRGFQNETQPVFSRVFDLMDQV